MNQESLAPVNNAPATTERGSTCTAIQKTPAPVHDEKCCGGTCEVAWKPVKIQKVEN
jgi:hypothetical protein